MTRPRAIAVLALGALSGALAGAHMHARAQPADAGAARRSADAGAAFAGAALDPGATLTVGYAGSPPFVLHEEGNPSGLSIGVWEGLANQVGVRSRYRHFNGIGELLAGVASGEVDVGVGPISVTAQRSMQVDFLHPYFSARVGIASSSDSSAWDRVAPLFSSAFLFGILTLTVVLLVVGVLVWQAERRQNAEQFPPAPLAGIGNGMWFALVTMTTVGYGDRAPVTVAGRVLTSVWMVLAMVLASSLTAGIASALTLSQIETGSIESLDDLSGAKVAVVRGTPTEKLARRRGARSIAVDSAEAGIEAVKNGDAAALLYDLPVLDYYLQRHPDLPLIAHGTPVSADDYAFAVAPSSPLRRPLARAVLLLRERGAIGEIASEWLAQREL